MICLEALPTIMTLWQSHLKSNVLLKEHYSAKPT